MRIPSLNGPIGGSGATGQILETVDLCFTNAQGATITLGYPVCLATGANSADGKLGVLPAANNLETFIGICLSNVPDNGVGYVRAYGYVGSIAIFATGSSATNASGISVGPAAGSLGVNSTGLKANYGPVVLLQSVGASINSAGGYAKGFVRTM